MEFLKGAKDLARNPLGIIALFISLIYGFASLLLNSTVDQLSAAGRWPIIIFIVIFPVCVLVAFYRLVTDHHGKLYAPGDFKDDKSFLRTLSHEEAEEKLDKEVSESLGTRHEQVESTSGHRHPATQGPGRPGSVGFVQNGQQSMKEFREEVRRVEELSISRIADELGVQADRNIGIGETEVKFDAFLQKAAGKPTFIEVKAVRSPGPSVMMLDRLLYHAFLADRFFNSNFKLIIAVVYFFEESDLERMEKVWKKKIGNCPVDIELKLISRDSLLKD